MITQRAGIYAGTGYTAALTIWVMTLLSADVQIAATAAHALQAVLLTQYLLIPLAIPWLARGSDFRTRAAGIFMFTFIPLPLLLVLAKISPATGTGVWLSQLGAAGLAATSYLLTRALLTLLARHPARRTATGTLQILMLMLVWAGRDDWLGWLTI